VRRERGFRKHNGRRGVRQWKKGQVGGDGGLVRADAVMGTTTGNTNEVEIPIIVISAEGAIARIEGQNVKNTGQCDGWTGNVRAASIGPMCGSQRSK